MPIQKAAPIPHPEYSKPPEVIRATAACAPWTPEREQEVRRAVAAEAMSWIGTPYLQMGDVKGPNGCVDCSMLLVRCWVDPGFAVPFDPRPYPPSWYMHHSEERYLQWMETVAEEVETPQVGDIILWKFGRCFSHSGILVDAEKGWFVHAYQPVQKCSMCGFGDPLLKWMGGEPRPVRFFDVYAKLKAGR